MSTTLPPLPIRAEVKARLEQIFPDGAEYRSFCTRQIAADTVFVFLYIGAIDGLGSFLGPKHIYKFSDEQEALRSDAERLAYARSCSKPKFLGRGAQWYADNTREPIRDETLRQGLIPVGAVADRPDLATTSSKPRYAIMADFAALFDPRIKGKRLVALMEKWRSDHLAPAAKARILVVQSGRTNNTSGVSLRLPNGESRQMKPGPSSVVTKHVIEEFAPRFLSNPAAIWVSESGNKVVHSDNKLAKTCGLNIDPSRNLPDVILADVAGKHIFLVFVEIVHSDGPISEMRRTHLLKLATDSGLKEDHVAFVTAYLGRDQAPLRKNLAQLAWNSFVWLASEPENIIALYAGGNTPTPLQALVQRAVRLHAVK